MGANPHSGEVEVTLDGSTYVLRPDFMAMVEIEEAVGSVIDLTRRALADQSLSFVELAAIIAAGMRAHQRQQPDGLPDNVSMDRVRELVFKTGIVNPEIIGAALRFLTNAVTGGAEPGNAAAAKRRK